MVCVSHSSKLACGTLAMLVLSAGLLAPAVGAWHESDDPNCPPSGETPNTWQDATPIVRPLICDGTVRASTGDTADWFKTGIPLLTTNFQQSIVVIVSAALTPATGSQLVWSIHFRSATDIFFGISPHRVAGPFALNNHQQHAERVVLEPFEGLGGEWYIELTYSGDPNNENRYFLEVW